MPRIYPTHKTKITKNGNINAHARKISSHISVKLPTNKAIIEIPKYIINIPNKNIFILITSLPVIIILHYRKIHNRQNAQNSHTKFS